jgi:uncharacterized protein
MSTDEVYVRESKIARPAAEVFAWHERPGALERLTPPWERTAVVARRGGLRDGDRVTLRIGAGPLGLTWEAEHRDYEPGRAFRDVMIRGPFAAWDHRHEFVAAGADACLLRDTVRYRPPGGPLGRVLAPWIRRKIERMFRHRHALTRADLEAAAPAGALPVRRVLVSGASGEVGRVLVPRLTTAGCEVLRLVRRAARGPDELAWDPAAGGLDLSGQERFDAVVHLAGANIAGGLWTSRRRALIRDSRVRGTMTLARALAALPAEGRPAVVVSASAIGWYGDTGDGVVDEQGSPGTGFLAEVCREWENAWAPAREVGLRVALLRTGVVLTPAGGALAKLLPAFRLGLGGRVGSGRQGLSWISAEDLAEVYWWVMRDTRLAGPINAVAPAPVSNAAFSRTLARVLHRPAVLPVPAGLLRLGLGDLARETLLASSWVQPEALRRVGFVFRHPELGGALAGVLGRSVEDKA